MGGRRGISTEHAIQHIINCIKRCWGEGFPIVTMLLLDVSGAYDNVSHVRLIHNLRKRRLGQLAPWIQSFLTGRQTRIRMPEYSSPMFATSTGIPQGSPLSPILYLIYNSFLVEDANPYQYGSLRQQAGYGWVDDVGLLT